MSRPDFHAALNYALSRLEGELSPNLLYHSFAHTRDDVLEAARKYARLSRINASDLRLLEVAAAFHDIGFLFQSDGHEQQGAGLARKVLPGFGFTPQQIERVYHLIMATRLPQSPHNLLEELLADADLDVLGREDFLVRNELLRQEIASSGKTFSDAQWYEAQLNFLGSHTYFSEAARRVRAEGKKSNILLLRQKLVVITGVA